MMTMFLGKYFLTYRLLLVVPASVLLLQAKCCISLQPQIATTTSTTTRISGNKHPPPCPPMEEHRYATHWENLLLEEYQQTVAELKERRKTWSRRRLEESGLSILGASAEPDSEVLGEKMVRIYKPLAQFRDRFVRGDVLVMTPVSKTTTTTTTTVEARLPRDCLIVDVGNDWLTVGVGATWPPGLYEARKLPGFFQVRLDRTAPQAPLRAQRRALHQLRLGEAGAAATLMARLFYDPAGAVHLASKPPPRFCLLDDNDDDDDDPSSFHLENAVRVALRDAQNLTSFQPNESQQEAIRWALQRRISLIRGPPGTGKTRVAALLVSTALFLQKQANNNNNNNNNTTTDTNARVLAVTHSNGAADVLLEALLQMGVPAVRVGRPASVSPNVQHRTVIAMTERMPEVVELRQRAADTTLDHQLRSAAKLDLRHCRMEIQNMITQTAPVLVASCIGAHQLLLLLSSSSLDDEQQQQQQQERGNHKNNAASSFPIVVLDEAAQTTEPALLCALAAAKAEQIVLVGDTQQLPPTITKMDLRDSLGVSPMARLEHNGLGETTLRVQYRMPPSLLEHPSTYFYKGLVVSHPSSGGALLAPPPPAGFPWPSPLIPLAFVNVGNGASEVEHNFGGRSNPTEAQLVKRIVSDLMAVPQNEPLTISVISPYSKQVQLIRTELSTIQRMNQQQQQQQQITTTPKNDEIRVGTVDSFQGQETDVVVFSAVRSNPMKELGFLRDSRRLCVALTRARRGLILVGDATVLQTCRHWAALLDSCTKRGCTMDTKEYYDYIIMAQEKAAIGRRRFDNKGNDDDVGQSSGRAKPQVDYQGLEELFDDDGTPADFYGLF